MFFKTSDLKYSANIHKKAPALESLFNKVVLKFFIKKRPQQHTYFSVNIANLFLL